MSRFFSILFCLLCLGSFLAVSDALADYYKYTDSHGVVSITNKLESVPAKYRSTMKVIKEDAPAKKEPGAQRQEEAVAPEQAPQPSAEAPAPGTYGKFEELSGRFPWFKPLIYLAVIVALFTAVTKITTLISSRLLSKVIYIVFSLSVFLFLFKTYSAHVVESSQKLKQDAVSAVKKTREVKDPLPEGAPAAPEPVKINEK